MIYKCFEMLRFQHLMGRHWNWNFKLGLKASLLQAMHNVLFVDFGAPVYKNALCRIQRHLLWSRIIYS